MTPREAVEAARDLVCRVGGADDEDRDWLDRAEELLSDALSQM